MRKIVLTFGLLAGLIMSAMLALATPFQDEIGFDRGAILGYTSMVLAFLMVYFGVRSYRDTVAEGAITFGRAFLMGLGIVMVATVCYVATWEVIYFAGDGSFTEKYAAHALAQARAAGASEAELAAKAKEMADFAEMYKNPLVNIAFTFLEPLPVGIAFSLLSAWLLSRRRRVVAMAPN
jgi:Protein of unknown function (DUF4199)